MLKKIGILVVMAFAIAGCASGPTPQDIAAADYGSVPDQPQAEASVKEFFDRYLKDPASAQYRFGKTEKGYIISDSFEGRKLYAGYLVRAQVNAKNSYGGYAGWSSYQFLFNNGQILRGQEIKANGFIKKIF